MTPAEKLLTAHLLDLAADQFSNHGCNDFDLAEIIGDRQVRDTLVKEIYAESYGADEEPGESEEPDWRLGDWELMRAMARRLRAEAAPELPSAPSGDVPF